jgi:hypothetical protein
MKYWLFLALKLAAGLGVVYGLQCVLVDFYPQPPPPLPQFGAAPPLFLHDLPFTLAIFVLWLFGVGVAAAIIIEHRRRCRICLRRLILPASRGSWGHLVTLGRPQTELICPWGHGRLSIEEVQITGMTAPSWHAQTEDIWKELESYQQAEK